ncbi:hypothetical protein P3X46_012727 [Hevea brasiliensis]|uniref:CR-type domain-containing protein n=1 Tax=Hevea brasiliensis TaxID=3981 RepID=A0ABQ9MB46_HEVBR|nr:uncharacterized protein LOC110664775 isoform X2 [Hevea brasiliensis]KAJ9177514.1 hypothetical protein P3X46_012727 [Hevea brasiliensis]
MAARTDATLLTVVQLNYSKSDGSNEKKGSDGLPLPIVRTPKNTSLPRLSLTKPSWVVRTESNVRKEIRKKPDPPCVVCKGTGRVDCHHCSGKGRTNCVNLAMLPKGEWPKWCGTCGGSGLGYCSRCLGTGEYRYIMGFHFMKTDLDDNKGPRSAVDQLHSGDQLNSNQADKNSVNTSIGYKTTFHFATRI